MKLSEAIVLGSTMVIKQGHGRYFGPEPGTACTMGMSLIAVGCSDGTELRQILVIHWPWATELRVVCPACPHVEPVDFVIEHLNDTQRWPAERIAAWVAKIEPPEPAVNEPADEVVLEESLVAR